MQGTTVSFIIPVYNLKGDRRRNFDFNIARATSAPFQEIIVVEQIGDEKSASTCGKLPNNVRYIRVISSKKAIEKSKLINCGVKAAQGAFLWINDADIYAPFAQVMEAIRPYHIVIKPFKYFIKIDQAETAEFISKRKVTTQSNYMDSLCAGAVIVRRNEFIKVRGMDERYVGWGYEDMEFALRLQGVFPIETFNQFRGVHLYHAKETAKHYQQHTTKNLDLYSEAKRVATEDVFEQINRIESPFPKNADWTDRTCGGVHVVCPAFQSKNAAFLHRQMLAISAINKADHRGIIKVAAFTEDEYGESSQNSNIEGWKKTLLKRDARNIGATRSLPYLKDLLDIARQHAKPEDFIIFSNADCGITRTFYKNLLNTTEDFVEYFRVNVANPNSVEDLWSNDPSKTREERDGIDAFAIRAKLYDQMKDLIPDLIVGEPYWDPVISGMFKKKCEILQNRNDLRHPEHPQEWNLLQLKVAGEHNKACWQKAFDKGLLDIRKCEIISDVIVVRVHEDGVTNYKAAANAFRFLRGQDLHVNHVFVDIVEKRAESKIQDNEIGTTGGKRIIVEKSTLAGKFSTEKALSLAIDSCPKARFILLLPPCAYSDDTAMFRRAILQLKEKPDEIIEVKNGLLTTNTLETSRVILKAMTRTRHKSLRSFKQEAGQSDKPDTAVIIATFGDDKLRTAANTYAFRQLQKQTLKVKYVWLELLERGQQTQLPQEIRDNPNLDHVIVESNPQNSRLFQKEALWNLAFKRLDNDIQFLFFFDSDIYCDKKNWFAKIRELLDFDGNAIVQPGSEVITLMVKEDGSEITRAQLTFAGHEDLRPGKQPYNFNPGLAVCLTRKMFESIGGFNPKGVMYGGDTIFLIETCKSSHQYYKHLMSQSSMRHIIRKDILNRKDLKINWKGVDNYITHVWHGDETNRTYWAWEHFLTTIDFNAEQMLTIDSNGLLAWTQDNPLFNFVFDRRSELTDRFVCRRLIREYYDEYANKNGTKIAFNPDNFAVDVWSINVKKDGNSIPFMSDGKERFLRLEAEIKNKSVKGSLTVLSFAPHFSTIDVSEMKSPNLVLEIRTTAKPEEEILLAVQSKEDDVDKAFESQRILLKNYYDVGFNWATVKIPMADFVGINLARLYGAVLKGNSAFTIDIRSMRIES